MAGGIAVVELGLEGLFHFLPTLLVAGYLYLLRDKIFLFRLNCADCGTRYSWQEVFYEDKPSCRCTPKSVDHVDWDSWQAKEEAVLCFIVKEGKVLLIHKKTGLGAGKINAPGGRIESGESAMEAAVRETEEETGLTPLNLEQRVDLSFIFTDGYSLHGRVFFAEECRGEMTETPEADPFWCDLDEIPYEKMWEDDPLWIPRALDGEKLKGVFIFEGDRMLSKRLTEDEEI
jgi:8-oxo-dGTP diphosphatase